jgi:hypothetical protein
VMNCQHVEFVVYIIKVYINLLLPAESYKTVMAECLKVTLDSSFMFKICTSGIKNCENMFIHL